MSGVTGRASVPQPPPTKTVVMYRNGDAFFPGRKFVINQRQMSTFDTFLSSVTQRVEAPFGAVRSVYTPRDGHRVRALEQLRHGEGYVAAGAERFKKLDYLQITAKKPQPKKNEQIRPVIHSRIIVPARWKNVLHEICNINVFTNGDILVPPARILIPKYTLRNWDRVLAMITEKVHLRTGAVHRLCTLDGTSLLGSIELENNQYYVAVGAEKFKVLPYFQWVPYKGSMNDTGHGFHSDYLPPIGKGRHTKDMSVYHKRASVEEEYELTANGLLKNHTDSFYAKPEKAKQHKHKLPNLLSAGEGSVFKAKDKRKETQGATEVQEDRLMKVDLPIDQVKARVVEEEQVESDLQPHTSQEKEYKLRNQIRPVKEFQTSDNNSSIPSSPMTLSPRNMYAEEQPNQGEQLSENHKKVTTVSEEQHGKRQGKNGLERTSSLSSLRHQSRGNPSPLTATEKQMPGDVKEGPCQEEESRPHACEVSPPHRIKPQNEAKRGLPRNVKQSSLQMMGIKEPLPKPPPGCQQATVEAEGQHTHLQVLPEDDPHQDGCLHSQSKDALLAHLLLLARGASQIESNWLHPPSLCRCYPESLSPSLTFPTVCLPSLLLPQTHSPTVYTTTPVST
ncbi:doublecortin domain-containing protein 2C [Amia ocellicauda]|uniref:doublecortin domain-containing protein 2C n=1 Tax=Amia ocellicauda TaxID=2972642 RepID=UPI0034645258